LGIEFVRDRFAAGHKTFPRRDASANKVREAVRSGMAKAEDFAGAFEKKTRHLVSVSRVREEDRRTPEPPGGGNRFLVVKWRSCHRFATGTIERGGFTSSSLSQVLEATIGCSRKTPCNSFSKKQNRGTDRGTLRRHTSLRGSSLSLLSDLPAHTYR